jgi:protein SCO1/2
MKKTALLFVILLALTLIYLFFHKGPHQLTQLPIYYPEDVHKIVVNGKEQTDTLYHTIPPFKFIDQNGDTITEKDFQDKIYVANFFFTTCPSICPRMMFQMERVNAATEKTPGFVLLSHTVNPAHDSVPVLAEYAKLIHADAKKWMLVTGKKKDIYDIAIDGYKLGVGEDARAPGGFLHSETMVLVDEGKRIRGYYDGTDSSQVDKLMRDITMLRAEYETKRTGSDLIQKR